MSKQLLYLIALVNNCAYGAESLDGLMTTVTRNHTELA